MTADVVPLHRSRDDYEDQVRSSIRAAMAGRGIDVEQLAEMTGMSVSTLYGRFAGSGSKRAFFAGEVAVIARALAVPIESIYTGKLDVSLRPPSTTNRYRKGRAA